MRPSVRIAAAAVAGALIGLAQNGQAGESVGEIIYQHCENCHGPQTFGAPHQRVDGAPRVSLASNVCAQCHGEPARHGRYQQWQLSGHANYELAMEEGSSDSCSRCHTGNGFVAWQELGFDPDENVDASQWTSDEIHPQTCATCHDPHAIGTTTDLTTNATVR